MNSAARCLLSQRDLDDVIADPAGTCNEHLHDVEVVPHLDLHDEISGAG